MLRGDTGYSADIVVPCYNEEDVLSSTASQLLTYFRALVSDPSNGLAAFRLIFVDDGSRDTTWSLITSVAENAEVQGVKLARNYGHQTALMSGLSIATADVVLSMDADMQDDMEAVRAMLAAYETGSDLALGIRIDRITDTKLKRWTAAGYYGLLSFLDINVVRNHGDFRLMSKRALAALLQHEEANLYLRGLITSLGFSVTLVPYKRHSRQAGTSKYTLGKMVGLGLDGITSFTAAPLRVIAILGGIISILPMLVGSYYLAERIIEPAKTVPGWASVVLPLLFLGGFQILAIGVLGEYVGKIYVEVKRRPRFIIEKVTGSER